ncbi:MAG: thiol:disulfide interchange protein DsbA [Enterobacterales bacterium]
MAQATFFVAIALTITYRPYRTGKSMKSKQLLMILLLLFTMNTTAQETSIWQPIEGQHYVALETTTVQNTAATVQFYFWPGSASCYQFELALQKWQWNHPRTEVKRIPLVKRPSWRLLSKAVLVAEELNLADTFINQLYQALHLQYQTISNHLELEQFLQSQNIDAVNFMTLFSSPLINQKLMSIEFSNNLLPLKGVPTIIINGQWLTDATMAKTSAQLLSVIDLLSAQSIEEE